MKIYRTAQEYKIIQERKKALKRANKKRFENILVKTRLPEGIQKYYYKRLFIELNF